MKSLNLAQPFVIIVVGMPGAGKSFFAKRFSEMFGAPVVNVDRLRYELFAEPTYGAEEAEVISRLVQYQSEELFKTKRSFLIDGGGNTKSTRDHLSHIAKAAGYSTLVIWVQTHEATAHGRATKRNPKRDGDAYNVSLSPVQFDMLARRFTPPSRENYVVISGMHTYNTQAKAVLRKLVAKREADAQTAHQTEIEATLHNRPKPDVTRRNVIIR